MLFKFALSAPAASEPAEVTMPETSSIKTINGTIYEKDLKDLYAMMVMAPELYEIPKSFFSRKHHKYSFTIDNAISVLKNLSVSMDWAPTVTTISYKVDQTQALGLIERFYTAKLLHSPDDRTRSRPKQGVLLQPTPKGVAIVMDFCKRVGIKKDRVPEIVCDDSYNTMELLHFERDVLSDRIVYSDFFLCILMAQLMGPSPNVWSPQMKPDPLPNLSYKRDFELDDFLKGTVSASVSKKAQSPFHHRYFTNPESDAHVQYYASCTGVRLFHKKRSASSSHTSPLYVSGKALVQWLCDCTDIIVPSQAVEIGNLLLSRKLIEPDQDGSSIANGCQRFMGTRDAFYVLGPLGAKVIDWDIYAKQTPRVNTLRRNPLTLHKILHDPGIRYLFRKHLESEYCVENLDLFMHLKSFEKKTTLLSKMLNMRDAHGEEALRIEKLVSKLVRMCQLSAYYIYFTFLSDESPFVANIDYKLRQTVNKTMLASMAQQEGMDTQELKKYSGPFQESGTEIPFLSSSPSSSGQETSVSGFSHDDRYSFTASSSEVPPKLYPGEISPIELFPGKETELAFAEEIENMIKVLVDISRLFSRVCEDVCLMMERDSLSKFVLSSCYQDVMRKIEVMG